MERAGQIRGSAHAGATGSSSSRQRAVLWHGPDQPVPQALLAALAKRSIPVQMVTSGLMALARACAPGAGPMSAVGAVGVLVVLVDPARLDDVSVSCAAMGRYVPRARCWCFEPGAKNTLRPVTDQDLVNWGAVEVSASEGLAAMASISSPASLVPGGLLPSGLAPLRLTGGAEPLEPQAGYGTHRPRHEPSRAEPEHAGGQRAMTHQDELDDHTLTPEELRMLLGRDMNGHGFGDEGGTRA